jgi:hypothetical protein
MLPPRSTVREAAPRPVRVPRRTAAVALAVLAAVLGSSAPALAAPPAYDAPAGAIPFSAVVAENPPNPTDREAVLDLAETTADAGAPRCLGAPSFARTGWAWVAPESTTRLVRVSATPVSTSAGNVTTAVPDLALFVQPVGGTPQRAQVAEPQLCDGREVFGDTGRGDVSPDVTAVLPAGRPALVQVGWRAGDPLGSVVASLTSSPVDALPTPAGDDPEGSPTVAIASVTDVPLAGATLSQGDPAQPACQAPATVWRRLQVAGPGSWTVTADGAARTLTAFGDPLTGESAQSCADTGDGGGLGLTVRTAGPGTVWLRLGVDRPLAGATSRLTVSDTLARKGAPPRGEPGKPLTAADALLQCTTHKLVLTNARTRGRAKVRLDGVAGSVHAGRKVTLWLVGRRKSLGSVRVSRSGAFARTVSVPKAGRRSGSRYYATMGRVKAAKVPLRPRFAVTSVGRSGTTRVAFRGRLSKPLATARAVRIQTATCARGRATWTTVRTVKRSRTGAVSARIARPQGASFVVVRATGRVRKTARGRTVSATTLTQVVGF